MEAGADGAESKEMTLDGRAAPKDIPDLKCSKLQLPAPRQMQNDFGKNGNKKSEVMLENLHGQAKFGKHV